MAPLQVEILRTTTELAAIRNDWAALLARSETNEIFLSPVWLETWWQVYGPLQGRELRVVAVREQGELVGLLPLLARRYWHRGAIPFRRLELLGTGEDEADEVCSDYIGLLAARGHEQPVARACAELVMRGALGAWDDLVLAATALAARATGALADALAAAGLRVERTREADADAPYVPLPGSWDDYLALLPGSRRSHVRKTLRKLERWGGEAMRVERVLDPGALPAATDTLIELHTRRWQASGLPGAFASPLFCAFHRRLMPALLERGALDLWMIRVGERPIAALYNIVWNDKVYFYQSGCELELPKDVRPGIAIHLYAIRDAIERGLREYDFLAGMEPFEARLSLLVHPLATLRATRRATPVELVRRSVEAGIDQLRRVRRPGPEPEPEGP